MISHKKIKPNKKVFNSKLIKQSLVALITSMGMIVILLLSTQTSQDTMINAQIVRSKIHLGEPAEFEAAKDIAVDFQKKIHTYNLQEINKVFLQYTLFAEAGSITSRLEFTFSLKADSSEEDLFHASFNLSGVGGKSAIDKILITAGRIFGKVPDTKRQIRIDLTLDEYSIFRTLMYWEVPSQKFRKQWANLLKKKKKVLEYKNKTKKPEKILELELQIRREEAYLWSPFLVEFVQAPERIIRYKKNNMDEEAHWENTTLPYSTQTDLFTAIFNYFLMDLAKENVFPVVFVFKDSERITGGKKKPKFVMDELELHTISLGGIEADDFYPCNMKLEIRGGQKLSKIFSNPIYLRREPVEDNGLFIELGTSVPSFIYLGDIMDATKKKKKILLGKIRAYLTNTSILPEENHKPVEDNPNVD